MEDVDVVLQCVTIGQHQQANIPINIMQSSTERSLRMMICVQTMQRHRCRNIVTSLVARRHKPFRRYRNVIRPNAGTPPAATVVVRIPITCCWQCRKFGWKCRSATAQSKRFQNRRTLVRTAMNAHQRATRHSTAFSIIAQIVFCVNMTNCAPNAPITGTLKAVTYGSSALLRLPAVDKKNLMYNSKKSIRYFFRSAANVVRSWWWR